MHGLSRYPPVGSGDRPPESASSPPARSRPVPLVALGPGLGEVDVLDTTARAPCCLAWREAADGEAQPPVGAAAGSPARSNGRGRDAELVPVGLDDGDGQCPALRRPPRPGAPLFVRLGVPGRPSTMRRGTSARMPGRSCVVPAAPRRLVGASRPAGTRPGHVRRRAVRPPDHPARADPQPALARVPGSSRCPRPCGLPVGGQEQARGRSRLPRHWPGQPGRGEVAARGAGPSPPR